MAEAQLQKSLSDAKIPGLPDSAFYMPNFLTEAEEDLILNKINNAPLPTWRQLSHRRLQTYPSPLTPNNALLASPLPKWLFDPIIPRMLSMSASAESLIHHLFYESPHKVPNHVLVNEYKAGQGIFPHEDGDAYHPIVATVSLASSLVLDIYVKKGSEKSEGMALPQWRILQEPRSLLVTTNGLYRDYLHGIAETEVDEDLSSTSVCNWGLLGSPRAFEIGTNQRTTRISLTFRDVLKVKELGKGLSFLRR